MKAFRSLNEINKFYFPITTKMEKEQEFINTETPEEIGKYWAKQTIEKLRLK